MPPRICIPATAQQLQPEEGRKDLKLNLFNGRIHRHLTENTNIIFFREEKLSSLTLMKIQLVYFNHILCIVLRILLIHCNHIVCTQANLTQGYFITIVYVVY